MLIAVAFCDRTAWLPELLRGHNLVAPRFFWSAAERLRHRAGWNPQCGRAVETPSQPASEP
jgi:hypothetical protein